ncbi:Hypothetical_protein [Hexamita inflata]|uniref:Hypothetical_protein n=1 Tax=Hexamita inflata TaxID=28002 RepID=A0AA86PHY9_9EUKA|nr:Hypothetical protein HINF_LOCUS25193 [Hexamita inflata]
MDCFDSYAQCFSSCFPYDQDCEYYDYNAKFCCLNVEKMQWWVWLLIALAILAFVSFISCCVCCCCSKKKQQQITIYVDKTEKQPLNPVYQAPVYQQIPVPQYNVPYNVEANGQPTMPQIF